MDRHVIRTSKTDSVRGIATKQHVDVELHQTAKSLPFPNISTTLSQRAVYEKERMDCNKFRLILTIAPYCTNVLFNALTEITKDEGGKERRVVTDDGKVSDKIDGCYGSQNPTRTQMISNTEYSSHLHGGYTYHPGYDFFDNHILRNKSFKVVNKPLEYGLETFNTLSDFTRDRNGEIQKFVPRKSIYDINNSQGFTGKKHLYLVDDIMKIDESINQNLYEENGWWGFINNSSIDACEMDETTKRWNSMDTSRVLNNHKACEFIDMYPDRSLFSFSPKYNDLKHRNENNWHVVVTYPYRNEYSHPICLGGYSYVKKSIDSNGNKVETMVSDDNGWLGLKIMNAKLVSGKAGGNNLIFRTYTRHGLSQGDMFYLYYTNPYKETDEKSKSGKFGEKSLNGHELYYESEHSYKVTNVGDLSRNNNEYYFYTSNLALLTEIYESYIDYASKLESDRPLAEEYDKDDKKGIYNEDGSLKIVLLNKILENTNFRLRRCVKGVKSNYYLRVFRKIPNFEHAHSEMTPNERLHISKFNGTFDDYVRRNASDPSNGDTQMLIACEQYQMAFASTIYNDNISQITFTDGIDVDGLTDNLGRPLSELYYTFVKNNAGNDDWYNGIYDSDAIEYSHCFGKVTSGLEMHVNKDDTEESTVPHSYMQKLSSANHISNILNNGSAVGKNKVCRNLDDDITYNSTFFHGDLVEFNPMECNERVLSNVMHRFNTAQRELVNNVKYSQYIYHEIVSDDYDYSGFIVSETHAGVNGYNDYPVIARPEGYIYKANYRIPIREYTSIVQDSHKTIRVRNAKPIVNGDAGVLIEVKTMLAHNLTANCDIYICDDSADKFYVTKCCGIIDRTTFLMSPNYDAVKVDATVFNSCKVETNITNTDGANKTRYIKRMSWLELCEILNGKYKDDLSKPKLVLRIRNYNIPDYATYIGGNKYIWRKLVNIGDSSAKELPDYIFANGYFYVTELVNFYLKRQDPYGNCGLYYNEDEYCFPNDPSGAIQSKENNFILKETDTIC